MKLISIQSARLVTFNDSPNCGPTCSRETCQKSAMTAGAGGGAGLSLSRWVMRSALNQFRVWLDMIYGPSRGHSAFKRADTSGPMEVLDRGLQLQFGLTFSLASLARLVWGLVWLDSHAQDAGKCHNNLRHLPRRPSALTVCLLFPSCFVFPLAYAENINKICIKGEKIFAAQNCSQQLTQFGACNLCRIW